MSKRAILGALAIAVALAGAGVAPPTTPRSGRT